MGIAVLSKEMQMLKDSMKTHSTQSFYFPLAQEDLDSTLLLQTESSSTILTGIPKTIFKPLTELTALDRQKMY